tara:strand:+ start:1521 stop:1790 length:270 start_codon:yes stop_codon:yes gene_type:complete
MTIHKAAQLYLDGYNAGDFGFDTGFNGWGCPDTARNWATMSLVSVIRTLTEIKDDARDDGDLHTCAWILSIFELIDPDDEQTHTFSKEE